jgi:hypothetical protein
MSSPPNLRTTRPTSRTRRWAGTAAIGTFAFVALVAVLLPVSAMGAPVTNTIRITAPFPGTLVDPSTTITIAGCGTATVTTAPTFHPSTGKGGLSGNAAMSHCTSGVGGVGSVSESLSLQVPIVATTGHDRIVEKWTVKAGGGTSVAMGICHLPSSAPGFTYCEVYAETYFEAYAYLYDANGTYVGSGDSTWAGVTSSLSDYEYCSAGNCSTIASGTSGTVGFSGTVTWTFGGSNLLASHSYLLDTFWYANAEVEQSSSVGGLHHCYGTAWINAGEAGNGITLDSITVT